MAIKTTDLEKEVLNALFRQEKPIIFSLKSGLEKLGRGHHKTSHMNRNQHADALIKGLDFRGNKTKQDWGGENLWGKVLNFSNEKKPLNDTRLNAIWEIVKKDKTWDEERFKGIEVEKKLEIKYNYSGSGKMVREVEGEVIVPQGPALPQKPITADGGSELILTQKQRIRELEKRNRELLNEVQAERRRIKVVEAERTEKVGSVKSERNRLIRRLAFYEMKPVNILEEYDEGDKSLEFESAGNLNYEVRGIHYDYRNFILIPFQENRLLYDFSNGELYFRDGERVGSADLRDLDRTGKTAGAFYGEGFGRGKTDILENIEVDEERIKYRGGEGFRRRSEFQGERTREQKTDKQRRELNKLIKEFENGGSPVIIGDYGGEMITIEEREGGMKFPKEYVVYNDDADKIGDWDKERGIINRIVPQGKPPEPQSESEEEEESSPEGFEDFIEIEFEGNDFLIDEDTDKVYAFDGIYVGEWVDSDIVWKNKEEKKKHDIIRQKETGAEPSSDSDMEDISSESDIETTDEEEESSDEDISEDMENIQLEYVDLIVDKIPLKPEQRDSQQIQAKSAGKSHMILTDDADYLGFFNYPLDKPLSMIRRWNELRDFVWVDSKQRQVYIDSMRDIMEDEGQERNIPDAESRVPTNIMKVQDQQIGGMTKGHFHKEVPVILHGGELVIPKKHVAEVMKQSALAHQISKIPPTWQKIKKIVK